MNVSISFLALFALTLASCGLEAGRAPASQTKAGVAAESGPTGFLRVYYWNTKNLGFGHTSIEVHWDQASDAEVKSAHNSKIWGAGTIIEFSSQGPKTFYIEPKQLQSYFSYGAGSLTNLEIDQRTYGSEPVIIDLPHQSLQALQDAMATDAFAGDVDPKNYKVLTHNCAHVTLAVLRAAGVEIKDKGIMERVGLTPWRVVKWTKAYVSAAGESANLNRASASLPPQMEELDRDPRGGDQAIDPASEISTERELGAATEQASEGSADDGASVEQDRNASSESSKQGRR